MRLQKVLLKLLVKNPFFSIIVTSLNRENVIEFTINSIKSQRFDDYEIIFVDGGSTDKTIEIINKIKAKNDKFFIDPNRGIYKAFNLGLKNASGKYIHFLNSDDLYQNELILEDISKSIKDNSYPDIIYGNAVYFSKNSFNKISRNYLSKPLNLLYLSKGFMPAHTATFIKNEIYKKNGYFDENFKICGDYEYFVRLLKQDQIKYIKLDKVITKMRTGGKSHPSLINTYNINREIQKSLKLHGIKVSLLSLYKKYFYKIGELINT